MEAQKLNKKKNTVRKGKIKKTLKNVICRPDPVFWPVVSDADANILRSALERHRVNLPEFQKPHWNDIKLLPKNQRPKEPQAQKVDGLIFGISACRNAIKTQNCSAVLVEQDVNPQTILQPMVEACTSTNISFLCLKDLRMSTLNYFGIKTSCLGVQKDCLQDLSNKIHHIFKNYKQQKESPTVQTSSSESENVIEENLESSIKMDVDAYCPYVYRSDKKSRTFVPSDVKLDAKLNSQFIGQQYIKLPQETKTENCSKGYLRMILKKVADNPNRLKGKHQL